MIPDPNPMTYHFESPCIAPIMNKKKKKILDGE